MEIKHSQNNIELGSIRGTKGNRKMPMRMFKTIKKKFKCVQHAERK